MMKTQYGRIIGIAIGLGVFAVCHPLWADSTNADPSKPIKIDRLVLYDVHGLWGGQNVFIAGNGTLWVQVVKPGKGSGFEEQRYKLMLKPEQLTDLEKALADHHFGDITIKERPGVPDETRPTIELKPVEGKIVKKSKWANDVNEDFTAIYRRLLALVPKPGSETPVYKGKFDREWHPEGFSR